MPLLPGIYKYICSELLLSLFIIIINGIDRVNFVIVINHHECFSYKLMNIISVLINIVTVIIIAEMITIITQIIINANS